jgi:hypothetical protein
MSGDPDQARARKRMATDLMGVRGQAMPVSGDLREASNHGRAGRGGGVVLAHCRRYGDRGSGMDGMEGAGRGDKHADVDHRGHPPLRHARPVRRHERGFEANR